MSLYTQLYNLRESYRRIFRQGKPTPKDITTLIDDLREFCFVDSSSVVVGKDGHVDVHATFIAEGRREVWLKISQTLNLTDADLNKVKENENG